MRLEQIRLALEAARAASNHREFVIAGSLSVLGYVDSPPEMMSMSIDIDFFPLRDPGRAEEIGRALGEDSAFHQENGYYLDPISPELPVLPEGWRERLVPLQMGEITAYFLDVHDIAISKYARSAPNDFRWIEEGYNAGILKIDTVRARAERSTPYPEDQDKVNTMNGLAMHQAAMCADGRLDQDLLAFLHQANYQLIKEPDTNSGRYEGRILWASRQRAVQLAAPGVFVVHNMTSANAQAAASDERLSISYEDGKMTISIPAT